MVQTFKLLAVVFVVFFLSSQVAMAHNYPTKIGEKLGNGIANVAGLICSIPTRQ